MGVFSVSIQSAYDSLDRVTLLVGEAAGQMGISEEEEADLMISVMEAVNNAIQHGNQEDASKKVHVRIETGPARATVWVRDEGGGFQYEAVPDPRKPQNLMNVSGRGILMMKAFMDEVEFEPCDPGMQVKMTKRFGSGSDREAQTSSQSGREEGTHGSSD